MHETTLHSERAFAVGEHISLGATSDPYSPLERQTRSTRASLREFAREATRGDGLRISITTRSPLVTRDIDVLRRIARRSAVHANMAVTTLDARLAEVLEPQAPERQESGPKARLRALRRLREAGIRAGLYVAPFLPGVTDVDAEMTALLRGARDAGALWVGWQADHLREPDRSVLLRALKNRYPRVGARYEVSLRFGTLRSGPGGSGPGGSGPGGSGLGGSGPRGSGPGGSGSGGLGSRRDGRLACDAEHRLRCIARRLGLAAAPHGQLPSPERVEQAKFAFGRA